MRSEKTKKRFSALDLCAAAAFLLLFGWFAWSVRFGVNRVDESFYLTIVQRFLQGDRVLVDEWHLSQLSALFQMLPFRIYTAAAGGTDGVILFMRYVFLSVHAVLYWFLYARLRPRGAAGLAGTLLFFGFIPFTLFTLSYYTMALHALLLVCALMFLRETPSAPALAFSGAVFSCAVLMEPTFALIYFVFSALALIRFLLIKKGKPAFAEYGFVLDGRVWKFFTLGVLGSAAAFLLFLQINAGLPDVIRNLPNLFTDSEYDFSAGGSIRGYFITKFQRAWAMFSLPASVALAVSLAGAAAFSIADRKRRVPRRNLVRGCLFLLSALGTLASLLFALLSRESMSTNASWFYFSVLPIPVSLFGASCYLLCDRKDRRLFCFFLVGLAASLCKDAVSEVSLGVGTALGYIPAAVFAPALARELLKRRQTAPPEKKKAFALFRAGAWALAALFGVSFAVSVTLTGSYRIIEHFYTSYFTHVGTEHLALDSEIESGPYKGIRTGKMIKTRQRAMFDDLDAIAARTDGPVYVFARFPAAYLYLDRPYCVYSTWFVNADFDRQAAYWRQRPEVSPAYIYIPYYHGSVYLANNQTSGKGWEDADFEKLSGVFDYETTRGGAGYILKVLGPA